MDAAIRSGRFDVMMLAYHHGIWPGLADLIRRARAEQDMGVVAMKTLEGARHRGLEEFQPYADSYAQAALKWALDNPDAFPSAPARRTGCSRFRDGRALF